jgi:hypothetical protein
MAHGGAADADRDCQALPQFGRGGRLARVLLPLAPLFPRQLWIADSVVPKVLRINLLHS